MTQSSHLAAALLALFSSQAVEAAAQPVPVRRVVEVFRLGGANARAPFNFNAPPVMVVDSGGRIFARRPSDGVVVLLGSDGRFIRSVGRKGAGPGEFQMAQEHGLLGDTLWVANWPTPRMSLFTLDGAHVSTFNSSFEMGVRFASPTAVTGLLAGGRAYVLPQGTTLGGRGRTLLPLVTGNRAMTRLDTIVGVPVPRGLSVAGVGTWSFDPMPASPLVSVSGSGSGIAIASWSAANPSSVEVRVVSPTGRDRFRRTIALESRPVPVPVRDSLLALAMSKAAGPIEAARRRAAAPPAAAGGSRGGGSLGPTFVPSLTNARLVADGLGLPTHYPPVRRVVYGIDGTVWLEKSGAGEGGVWRVLSQDGRDLFDVRIAAGLDLQQASAASVWATARDALDVPYIVRLNLM